MTVGRLLAQDEVQCRPWYPRGGGHAARSAQVAGDRILTRRRVAAAFRLIGRPTQWRITG